MRVESALHGCSRALDRGDASFQHASIILASRTLHLSGAVHIICTCIIFYYVWMYILCCVCMYNSYTRINTCYQTKKAKIILTSHALTQLYTQKKGLRCCKVLAHGITTSTFYLPTWMQWHTSSQWKRLCSLATSFQNVTQDMH